MKRQRRRQLEVIGSLFILGIPMYVCAWGSILIWKGTSMNIIQLLSNNLNGDNTVGVIVIGLIVIAWVIHSITGIIHGGRRSGEGQQ